MANKSCHFDFYRAGEYSYEQVFTLMNRLDCNHIEKQDFFRRMVFNIAACNCDDHVKNFSFLMDKRGLWHLAPAYDLINTSLHLGMPRIFALDKGLFKEGMQMSDTKTVSREDFEEFGRRIGLASRLIKRELDTFATDIPLAKELIGRSFLSDALKRSYWLSYKYRRNTLYK